VCNNSKGSYRLQVVTVHVDATMVTKAIVSVFLSKVRFRTNHYATVVTVSYFTQDSFITALDELLIGESGIAYQIPPYFFCHSLQVTSNHDIDTAFQNTGLIIIDRLESRYEVSTTIVRLSP